MKKEGSTIKEHIKEVFLELYSQMPLSKIKIGTLIEKCAISRGTFYFYFQDIYDLYYQCEQDLLTISTAKITEVNLSTVRGSYEKHIPVYCEQLKHHEKYKDQFKVFINGSESRHFEKAFFESIRINYGESLSYTTEAEGPIFDYLINFQASGLANLYITWLSNDCDVPAEDLAELVSRVMFKGTYPAK